MNFHAFFIHIGRLYILPFEISSICTIALQGFFLPSLSLAVVDGDI